MREARLLKPPPYIMKFKHENRGKICQQTWQTVFLHSLKMPGLKEVREALLLAYSNNYLDDEEFLLLYDMNKSQNPDFPYWSTNHLT